MNVGRCLCVRFNIINTIGGWAYVWARMPVEPWPAKLKLLPRGCVVSACVDVSLAYAATGYRAAELASGSCDSQRSLLACLKGRAKRGHGGGKKKLALRAKEGF